MLQLGCRFANFPAGMSLPAHWHSYAFSWSELTWAAITVGRRKWSHVIRHGIYSGFEIVYRSSIVYANLMEGWGGHLLRTSAYASLDPSEKSAISYFIGLTAARLFSEKSLDVAWLMHLDSYSHLLSTVYHRPRVRPDLVGLNSSGDWVVVEAKGRSNGFDEVALAKAKDQTANINTIDGTTPALRVAVQAYFSGDHLNVQLEDPEEFNRDIPDIRLTRAALVADYYRPIVRLLENTDQEIRYVGEVPFVVVRLDDADLSVGLSAGIFKYLRQGSFAFDRFSDLQFRPSRSDDGRTYAGRDGVLVQLGDSWDRAQMRREPEERERG